MRGSPSPSFCSFRARTLYFTLTCFIGSFSVSAATYSASITVADTTITQGNTTADIIIQISSPDVGINEARLQVSSSVGTISTKVSLVKDASGTSYTPEELETLDFEVAHDVADDGVTISDYNSFWLSGKTYTTAITSAFIKVTFNVSLFPSTLLLKTLRLSLLLLMKISSLSIPLMWVMLL